MAEYINKSDLLDELCRDNCERKYDGTCHNCRMTETIADFPAADVEPAVRGEWIDSPDGTTTICSYCKADWNVFDNNTYRFNYCPNCGAKMDLEDRKKNEEKK